MNSDPGMQDQNARLLDFASRFLKEKGALIEEKSGGINALLPRELAGRMETKEYIILGTRPDEGIANETAGQPDLFAGYYPIHFGSPLLDRMLRFTSDNPPLLNITLNFLYLKSGGFENLIAQHFEWHKATVSVTSFGQIHTRYLLFNCRYLAQSDEQKEGRFDLAANLDTGAIIPGITSDFAGIDKEFKKTGTLRFSESDQVRLRHLARVYGKEAVDREIAAFRDSMNRRYARDAKSLDDYYHALAEEMAASLERTNISDSLAVAMVVSTPAVKVLFTASVGRERKNLSLIYNPVTKLLDPLVCESCYQSTYWIDFSKDLHVLCPHCYKNK